MWLLADVKYAAELEAPSLHELPRQPRREQVAIFLRCSRQNHICLSLPALAPATATTIPSAPFAACAGTILLVSVVCTEPTVGFQVWPQLNVDEPA